MAGPLRYHAEVAIERLQQANLTRRGLAASARADLADAFWRDTEEAERLTGMDLLGWCRAEGRGSA
jgi:hypothetical protein